MRHYLIAAAILSLIVAQSTAHAQEATPDGLKALNHFVGSWNTTATNKTDGSKTTVGESTNWILKDRFILGRESSQPDGVKSLWLMTFEPESKTYPFWYFNNKGGLGAEWGSTWNGATKTLTGKATDTPPGWTSGGTNHFPDENTNNAAFWMKDDSGKMLFDVEAKKTRQPDESGKGIVAAWSKQESADPPLPSELKILERMIGNWDATSVSKVAEWTPQEVRTTSKVTRKWILDGYFVQDTAEISDGTQSIALTSYDPQMNAYRAWWFNSEGNKSKSTGQWDSGSKTISYTSDLGNGITVRNSVRFIDMDNEEWNVVIKDGDGKLYLDLNIKSKRRKE
jgi:hypothetical protein